MVDAQQAIYKATLLTYMQKLYWLSSWELLKKTQGKNYQIQFSTTPVTLYMCACTPKPPVVGVMLQNWAGESLGFTAKNIISMNNDIVCITMCRLSPSFPTPFHTVNSSQGVCQPRPDVQIEVTPLLQYSLLDLAHEQDASSLLDRVPEFPIVWQKYSIRVFLGNLIISLPILAFHGQERQERLHCNFLSPKKY